MGFTEHQLNCFILLCNQVNHWVGRSSQLFRGSSTQNQVTSHCKWCRVNILISGSTNWMEHRFFAMNGLKWSEYVGSKLFQFGHGLCDIGEYLNIILSTLRICTWEHGIFYMKGCGFMELIIGMWGVGILYDINILITKRINYDKPGILLGQPLGIYQNLKE